MSIITSIEDLRILAQRRVPRMFYDYADSGSWTESTYCANSSDFAKIKFRQRVAVNLENRSLASTMVGQPVSMPVALSPTGLTGMQHADGEILAAQAAEQFGVPFTLSTMSICSIEDVAANTTKPFWFQLYVMKDREFINRLIDRAKAAKCGALVLTLDLQVLGQRDFVLQPALDSNACFPHAIHPTANVHEDLPYLLPSLPQFQTLQSTSNRTSMASQMLPEEERQ